MQRTSIALIAVLLLILTACGSAAEELAERAIENETGGDVELDLDSDGGSVNIESDDGSLTIGGGVVVDRVRIGTPVRARLPPPRRRREGR